MISRDDRLRSLITYCVITMMFFLITAPQSYLSEELPVALTNDLCLEMCIHTTGELSNHRAHPSSTVAHQYQTSSGFV